MEEPCWLDQFGVWHGDCDPDGPGGPEDPEDPEDPNDPEDPEDPGGPGGPGSPEDPPGPVDPCDDYTLDIDLDALGMPEVPTSERFAHEDAPGGYIPVNRGFDEWYRIFVEDFLDENPPPPGGPPAPTPPPPDKPPSTGLYEDFESGNRFVMNDPDIRAGWVGIGTSYTGSGKTVPFSIDVPEGLDVWIYYDGNVSDGTYDPVWKRVDGQSFSAGDKRPYGFPLRFEGRAQGLDKTVTASADLTSICSDLSAEDSVLMHVANASADADADNDAGFDPASADLATLADRYLEWISQYHGIAVPGKLLAVNGGDLGGDGTPDWADGFDADGIPWSSDQPHLGYPHDDYSPDTQFTPIKVTLPAWQHGAVRFRFEYDAADPQYTDPAHPELRLDPRDMLRTGNEQDGYSFDPGEGSLRLWLKDGGERRDGADVRWGGDYIDSMEVAPTLDPVTGLPTGPGTPGGGPDEPAYYTHQHFGIDPAVGGTVTLWVEALEASTTVGAAKVTVKADYTLHKGSDASVVYAEHGLSAVHVVPFTALGTDLDIDSDNDAGFFGQPSGTTQEDSVEDQRSGKLIVVNRDDDDDDRIVDYADGYGLLRDVTNGTGSIVGDPTPLVTLGEQFVPIVLRVNRGIAEALGGATVSFRYDASDPGAVLHSSKDVEALDGATVVKHAYAPGQGLLRIWRKAGDAARALSDYIEPDTPVDVESLFPTGASSVVLYVEAVNGFESATRIDVEVTYGDGPLVTDAVRILALDPLVGIAPEQLVNGYRVIRGDGSTLLGTPANDILIGTGGYEQIDGDAGDDIILAGRNVFAEVDSIDDPDAFAGDTIDGGAGADLIFAWFGSNLIADDGADVVSYIEGAVDPTGAGGAAAMTEPGPNDGTKSKPFSSEDIEAAYAWMYGVNDPWIAIFKELGGRVLAVDQDGRNFSQATIDWKQTQGFGAYVGYDVKIEHRVESVMHAAAILRKSIMDTSWEDRARVGAMIQGDIVDPVLFEDPVAAYQEFTDRNFNYAKEVATTAAELYFSGMSLMAGPGGDIADVIITLADLFDEDTIEKLLDILPLVPGNLTEQAAGGAMLTTGPNLFARARAAIESATGRKFVLGPNVNNRDALFAWNAATKAPRRVGVVLRRDLLNSDAVSPNIRPRFNADRSRVSLLIGTAQSSGGTHAATINRIGEAMARGEAVQAVDAATGAPRTIPARNYSHGTLNRAWRTATGRVVGSAERPDLIFVGEDGRIYAYEVVSPGQQGNQTEIRRLKDEMDAVLATIDPDLRGEALVLDLDA